MKHAYLIHPELAEAPHHLVIWIHGMDSPLFDEQIASPKKSNEIFLCGSPELWTPKGLPLKAVFSGKQGFSLYTADTLLLSTAVTGLLLDIRLLLPTDELLTATVEVRPS